MGCIDKVGGILISIIAFIFGITSWSSSWQSGLSIIVGAILFAILSLATDPYDYVSFIDAFDSSPLFCIIFKIIINAIISGVVAFGLGFLLCI